ncbi:DSD1 family PLP-dependent enzyme [Azohydromonas aeria]|uniref:DSD1 family PLP-dependent enzyme n=1 Tax=Azohydromonas aeria TaxID=2590212 RepID=UPI0012FA0322|nr:DSD1 family PLP-dependent enzyme [Azohydromonas aeria]
MEPVFDPFPPAAVPGSPLAGVDTPALLLDLDAFERNLDRMQAAADAAGVALRPHAKAHKCPAVALAQLARGAVGVCCQKASEALPFLRAGVRDVHVSNELATPDKARALARWARHARLSVCVDDALQVQALAEATREAGTALGVLVEIDIGQGRCGVAGAAGVLRLLEQLAPHAQLEFRGLQAYQGGLQHLRGRAERREQALRAAARAADVVAALQARGLRCATVTGGGTGSVEFDLESGVYTELQPGSYAFMDRDYADNEPGTRLRFEHALFVATRVMSTAAGTHAVVDAGLKSMSLESGLPRAWPPGAPWHYTQANDEHGLLTAAARDAAGAGVAAAPPPPPALGSLLRLVPGHCDPTFNLHDEVVAFRGDRVEAVWPVTARGYSR